MHTFYLGGDPTSQDVSYLLGHPIAREAVELYDDNDTLKDILSA
jgi:hypothetical protein